MSDHVLEKAKDDVFFNTLALKKKAIASDLFCANCHRPSKGWVVISICHHLICQMCIEVATRNTPSTSKDSKKVKLFCPTCSMIYQSYTANIRHKTEIKSIITELEEFIWAIHSNMYGLLEENFYAERGEEPTFESSNNPQSRISLARAQKNKKTKYDRSNGFTSKKPKKMVKPTFYTTEQLKNIETSSNNVYSNDYSVSNISHEYISDEEITTLTESIQVNDTNNTSNEDVIYGTPDKLVLNGNRNIVVACTNLSCNKDVNTLIKLTQIFNVCVFNLKTKWDGRITHLVVKTLENNICPRTLKLMYALVSGCFIVNFDWVLSCLRSRTLLPENGFMPFDITGVPSPLTVWRVNQGIIESPLIWTKTCILYFHRSTEFDVGYSKSPVWAMKAGFMVANDMADFKSKKFKMQVILVDVPESEDVKYVFPERQQILAWLNEYKAVTIYIDWFLECMFRYEFVLFESQYQVLKLNKSLLAHTDMEASLFQLDD